MAGSISFPSIGSNFDVQSIINAYVAAESASQNQMQKRVKELQSASTSISSISSALSAFSTALSALADAKTVQSYSANSSGAEVVASLTGTPQAGSYSVDVIDTAKEYRAYSSTLGSSASDPASLDGLLRISVGPTEYEDVLINPLDSIDIIVGKINSTGLRVTASTFYDGSSYRIQLRGLDTGEDNQITLSGLDLGFSDPGNAIQQASNAHLKVDGLDVYSKTNQISGAISGVTLAATAKTTSSLTINVQPDPEGLTTKVQSMVTAYNAIINQVHSTAGYGTTKASVASLAGDATLRSLTDALSRTILTEVATGTKFTTLGSLGISLQKDGTLNLNSTKLTEAITSEPNSVVSILAGPTGGEGVMDLLTSLVKSYDEAGDGVLTMKASALNSQAADWTDHVDREQARIDNYTKMLQAQFTAMTQSMSASTSMANYLNAIFGTTTNDTTK